MMLLKKLTIEPSKTGWGVVVIIESERGDKEFVHIQVVNVDSLESLIAVIVRAGLADHLTEGLVQYTATNPEQDTNTEV